MKFGIIVSVVLTGLFVRGAEKVSNAALPEDFEEKRAIKRAEIVQRAGGYARKTDQQKGRVVFANLQNDMPAAMLEKVCSHIGSVLRIAVDLVPGTEGAISSKTTADFLQKIKANAVIYLVSTEDDDAILLSPEGRWAKINVNVLKGEHFEERVKKEMIRSFVFLFGGGTSDLGHPLLDAITDVRQLDGVPSNFPQDPQGRLEKYLAQLGVTPYLQTTYRRACRLGWAPPPTNDVQKAIWDKVKSEKERGPTNPIKITPGQK